MANAPEPIQLYTETRRAKIWHKYLRRPYKLNVIDHGGSGPIIVLLHGLASSSANWEHLIPLLADSHRCVSIELIGFGDSPKPQWFDYTIESHSRNIKAAINNLRLDKPFMLVGHSLGSLLATRYARQHQGSVERLVLLSPPVYMPLDSIDSRGARQRTSLYLRAYKFLRTHPRITPENIIRLSRILPPMKFLVLNQATWIPFVRSLERCIETQTIVDDIAHVKAPIDIFYGIFDEVIVPYNIKHLKTINSVTLHPLKLDHTVSKRYARAVAEALTAKPIT